MMKSRVLPALAFCLLSLSAASAFAAHKPIRVQPENLPPELPTEIVKEEEKLDTLLYKPDYCDFYAKFPSEPTRSHRCELENPDRCYDLVSYTKVFEMTSTVKAEIVCNPLPEGAFEKYTPEIMKETVLSMAQGEVVQGYEPNVQESANFKQAGMVGRGRAGMGDTIFVAQLWVGRHSIMAVQAEMMGTPVEEAESHFADLLRSIGYDESDEEKAERLAKEKEAESKAAQEASESAEKQPAAPGSETPETPLVEQTPDPAPAPPPENIPETGE